MNTQVQSTEIKKKTTTTTTQKCQKDIFNLTGKYCSIHCYLLLRWDITVRREAAGVYQPSNNTTERDPETHWQSCTQCEEGTIMTLGRCIFFFLSKSCIFHCQYIFFFFFNNNKTADKDRFKKLFLSVRKCLTHTLSWCLVRICSWLLY